MLLITKANERTTSCINVYVMFAGTAVTYWTHVQDVTYSICNTSIYHTATLDTWVGGQSHLHKHSSQIKWNSFYINHMFLKVISPDVYWELTSTVLLLTSVIIEIFINRMLTSWPLLFCRWNWLKAKRIVDNTWEQQSNAPDICQRNTPLIFYMYFTCICKGIYSICTVRDTFRSRNH